MAIVSIPRVGGFRSFRRASAAAFAALALWGVGCDLAIADPLLVPGKTDIFQRILTRPGAVIANDAGGARVADPKIFSAYYVFAKKSVGGAEWLQIGPGRKSAPVGWIPTAKSVPWNHTMILEFKNPADRDPVLFFDTRDNLRRLLEAPDGAARTPTLAAAARRGTPPAGSGILSIEPPEWVDIRTNFYLLPVMEANKTFLPTGGKGTLVRVASIPLGAPKPPGRSDFKAGIMFVIDTTTSMQPYIDRTRQAVERAVARIRGSSIGANASFGLIGFRNALGPDPRLGYVTKVMEPLKSPPDHDEFLRKIAETRAARVSSPSFDEDGLAGVMEAIGRDEWKNFDGRFIVYVSDAGMVEPPDPNASTGLTVEQVNHLARDKRIAVFSLQLKTPEGRSYQDHAAQQLNALSRWSDCDRAAFAVEGGSVDAFGASIDALTDRLIHLVEEAKRGPAAPPPAGAAPEGGCAAPGGSSSPGRAADIDRTVDDIGYAMRLSWLGHDAGAAPPDLFEAWAADFVQRDPTRKALEVQVLLTKQQLSRMADALDLVTQAGSAVIDSEPDRFFDQLRTVVARAARDPSRLSGGAASGGAIDPGSLDNLGTLLGEYLRDLPYSSKLMEVTPDAWRTKGPAWQNEILREIRSKLHVYQRIHDDPTRWIALADGAPDDERVAPVALEYLP